MSPPTALDQRARIASPRNEMEIALALVGLFVFAGVVAALVVKRLLVVCQPHEILVLVGAKRQVGGHVVGYRLIRGGRTMRTPFIERVERLDLSEIPVEFRVTRAYSKGNIPLAVDAVARVKIDGREPEVDNAIERFLGRPRSAIAEVARQSLEGQLREALAQATAEEVERGATRFAELLIEESQSDFRRLGLVVETLEIRSVRR